MSARYEVLDYSRIEVVTDPAEAEVLLDDDLAEGELVVVVGDAGGCAGVLRGTPDDICSALMRTAGRIRAQARQASHLDVAL